MNDLLSGKKKLITMILGIVSGLAIAFGLDQSEISSVAGAVVAVGSVISYMIAEGKIDVERIKTAADSVNEVLELLDGVEEVEVDEDDFAKPVEGFVANSEGGDDAK